MMGGNPRFDVHSKLPGKLQHLSRLSFGDNAGPHVIGLVALSSKAVESADGSIVKSDREFE